MNCDVYLVQVNGQLKYPKLYVRIQIEENEASTNVI